MTTDPKPAVAELAYTAYIAQTEHDRACMRTLSLSATYLETVALRDAARRTGNAALLRSRQTAMRKAYALLHRADEALSDTFTALERAQADLAVAL